MSSQASEGTSGASNSEAAAAPIFVARELHVSIAGRQIVRGVTLSARRGEVIGLLGPSGSGKSSFFRAAAGEGPGSWRELRVGGKPLQHLPTWARARAGLGYMPQEPSVLWDHTARENLEIFSRVRKPAVSVRDALEQVGLRAHEGTLAGKLSGGERRRLELARILLAGSDVLLCDEPFAGVDPKAAQLLGELLVQYAANGRAVVLADHHISEALRVCSRALLLVDGAVVVEARADEFANHPVVQQRYLATQPAVRH